MKLIAEIQAKDGGVLRLSCEGETLSILDIEVPLVEFRAALDAVAPQARRPVGPIQVGDSTFIQHGDGTATGPIKADGQGSLYRPPPPTRDASGARIGPSPRFSMRAVKPEANVEVTYETLDDLPDAAA